MTLPSLKNLFVVIFCLSISSLTVHSMPAQFTFEKIVSIIDSTNPTLLEDDHPFHDFYDMTFDGEKTAFIAQDNKGGWWVYNFINDAFHVIASTNTKIPKGIKTFEDAVYNSFSQLYLNEGTTLFSYYGYDLTNLPVCSGIFEYSGDS